MSDHQRSNRQQMVCARRSSRPDLSPAEITAIISFARAWAPYGGPPEDELFVQFGVTKARFVEMLGQVVDQLDCDTYSRAALAVAYPTSESRE